MQQRRRTLRPSTRSGAPLTTEKKPPGEGSTGGRTGSCPRRQTTGHAGRRAHYRSSSSASSRAIRIAISAAITARTPMQPQAAHRARNRTRHARRRLLRRTIGAPGRRRKSARRGAAGRARCVTPRVTRRRVEHGSSSGEAARDVCWRAFNIFERQGHHASFGAGLHYAPYAPAMRNATGPAIGRAAIRRAFTASCAAVQIHHDGEWSRSANDAPVSSGDGSARGPGSRGMHRHSPVSEQRHRHIVRRRAITGRRARARGLGGVVQQRGRERPHRPA
jgi:hypothetical protein